MIREHEKYLNTFKVRVGRRDIQLVGMLIGQVTLYLFTNIPYASMILYGYVTESIPASSKSPERIAIEGFSSTLFTSFLVYCFNGVNISYLSLLILFNQTFEF